MFRYNLIVILVALFCSSCNKESVQLSGKIAGEGDSKVELRLNSINDKTKTVLADMQLKGEEFSAYLENVKPPFKLTMVLDSVKQYNFWVFRYGKFDIEIDKNGSVNVNNSMEYSEYDRICKNYSKMYLTKIAEVEKWVKTKELEENLCDEDKERLFNFRKEIKKAYKLRKKSILSTFRKNPQNRIAMALLFDEYERLTTWQKEECLKNAQKYFSDCGINWQLRN
jgi:hypothetical protein